MLVRVKWLSIDNKQLLLCLAHIEGAVVGLAPHGQVFHILPLGGLVVVGDQMGLESCLAVQS